MVPCDVLPYRIILDITYLGYYVLNVTDLLSTQYVIIKFNCNQFKPQPNVTAVFNLPIKKHLNSAA